MKRTASGSRFLLNSRYNRGAATTNENAAQCKTPSCATGAGQRGDSKRPNGVQAAAEIYSAEGRVRLRKLLLRWLVNALALFAAAQVVPGIEIDGNGWIVYAVVAIIFGLVNALIRPLLKMITCPLIILTLGLFTLVINALMLLLTSWIGTVVGYGFHIDGFWPAFLGGLVVGVVSVVLNLVVQDEEDRRKRKRKRD